MISFTSNKIVLDLETISEQLKTARLEKDLKLHDVARILNINSKYLQYLEQNEFYKLPAGVYGKSFLKEYAAFLDLDYNEMTGIYEKEMLDGNKAKRGFFSAQVIKNSEFFTPHKLLKGLVVSSIVIVCFAYLGYRLERITAPPVLVLNTPHQDLITEEKTINISGLTEAETHIVINGETALSDNEGNFSKKVDLRNGLNMITIVAKKKHGKENTITRQILVRENKL